MPMYEYHCESNGCLVEVQHKMDERLLTWGELCERAGISTGPTDPRAKVEKLMSAGFINAGASSGANLSACRRSGVLVIRAAKSLFFLRLRALQQAAAHRPGPRHWAGCRDAAR
jgi:hypothetical protein